MIVSMVRINLEPALDVVAPMLGMRACLGPVGLGQAIEQLGRRASSRSKREQRVLDRSVVEEPSGEFLLIVSADGGMLLGNQEPQPDGRCHLAVRQMMNDFARRPFVWRRPGIELGFAGSLERRGDGLEPVFV